jgi:hypothetical protein
MKIAGYDTEAFVLHSGQAAIAQHTKPTDNAQPMVQIVSLGMGVSVCGVDALQALRRAIDHAIDGPQEAGGTEGGSQ